MVLEQIGMNFENGGALDIVLAGMTSKKINRKLAHMGITVKINFLETALGQVNSLDITRDLNISLGKTCSEMASSVGYGQGKDRIRAEYLYTSNKCL